MIVVWAKTIPPLGHDLQEVAQAQLEAQVPANAQDNDLSLEVPPFERVVMLCSLCAIDPPSVEGPGLPKARFAPEPPLHGHPLPQGGGLNGLRTISFEAEKPS